MLRWKLAKDQALKVTCTQETEVETSINNKPRRATLDMAMEIDWLVGEVDGDGTATIEQSIQRVQLKTTAPDADPVAYDSASASKPTGAAKEIAANIAPLIGASFTVKMDARGDVREVTMSDETKKKIDDLPADNQLKPLLTKEGLANLFRLGGGILPEKAVKPGDTWPADQDITTPFGTLKQKGTFTYTGQEKAGDRQLDNIKLSATSKLEPAKGGAKVETSEQTKTGILRFDSTAGRAVSSETKLLSKSVRTFRDTPINVKISGVTKVEIGVK
jgi:hypothetical protein